ncbi:unnamed protein product [Prorocentrum cordatum]|uniref:Uncharacterized protein n=1 Tax=Prorocentrum cordatum TaxID=2364126 RepID=A0ABN9U4A9_9DINO|nr:unnamed protein product [Polarella glacialis]
MHGQGHPWPWDGVQTLLASTRRVHTPRKCPGGSNSIADKCLIPTFLLGREERNTSQREDATVQIDGCHIGWRNAPVHILRNFHALNSNRIKERRSGNEEAPLKNKRLLWRIGNLDQKHIVEERCSSRVQGRLNGRAFSSRSVWMYERLRSAGVAVSGWIVNFGAGGWTDPMHELARHNPNMSAIFVDPQGTRGQRPPHSRVHFVQEAASPVNLCSVLSRGGLACSPHGSRATPIDFVKIDIDSFDCALAKAILRQARPKAVWIAVNIAVPPPVRFSRQWDPRFFEVVKLLGPLGRTPATLGCSTSAAVALFREEGYGLYASDGQDLVFVHGDLEAHVGEVGVDEFLCHRAIMDADLTLSFVDGGHVSEWIEDDASEVLRNIWCNFTLHDYLLGLDGMPFAMSV